VTNTSASDQAVELLLRFARAAHSAGGYPANELEPRILELARALGLDAVQVVATPTAVEISVGPIPHQHVYVLRVQPRPVNLDAIERLETMSAAVASGRLDPRRALEQIEELARRPINRPLWLFVVAHGLIGAGLAPSLGGGWRESFGAAMVGLVVGFLTRTAMRHERSAALIAPLGAFLSSVLASALAVSGFPVNVGIVTFAALIVFFPAMPMVIGVRELSTAHLQAGVANSVNALVQLIGVAFGVAVGRSLVTSGLGAIPINAPDSVPKAVAVVAAALVGRAFVVTLRAPARDAIWTSSAAVLASAANVLATGVLGNLAGVFLAALVVGVTGNTIARRFRRSPLPFIVPGSLLLVPGNVGYVSATSLLAGRTTPRDRVRPRRVDRHPSRSARRGR
jgi:uncharacterized membrane protein YjjP (DUF1212 family)